ncbi:P2Y purinoceptor 14-like [Sphaeramia orbicularis]|uniref:P2Y purinoceptor 14-like n=1 Tax=Sphaeramia orbicularis TaxID=375764 RepID=UPI0011809E49|nr:P2Y purinoceptor 14-like [Sphaeramia orbicularis]
MQVMMNQSIINNTMCHEFNNLARIFFIVSYSLVFLVGLLLNGFILWFYFCQSQRSSSTIMVYLKNLVAADFLLSLCLPFSIVNLTTTSNLTIRLVHCKFGIAIFYLNMYASILFMAHIAYNRYLKIIHPFKTHFLQTVRAAHIISIVTWVFLLTVLSIYVCASFITQKNLTSIPYSCEELHNKNVIVLHRVIHSSILVAFLSVLIFMLYVYCHTSHEVSLAQQSQLTSSSPDKLAKSRRNMMVLIIVFCICFIPFHLVHVPYIFLECSQGTVLFLLEELTRVFSVLNICLDPFTYFIFSKDLREQLKNVLQRDKPTPNNESGSS